MPGSDQTVIFIAACAALQTFRCRAAVDLTSISGRELHLLNAAFALDTEEGTLVAELSTDTNDRHRPVL